MIDRRPLPILPEHLASCPVCCCLVLVRPFPAGDVLVWDPEWAGRRIVRSYLHAEDLRRQGFGLGWGRLHECPPEDDCAITHRERRHRRPAEGECGQGDGREHEWN